MHRPKLPARRALLALAATALVALPAAGLPASAGAARSVAIPKPGQGGKLVFAGSLPSLWDPALSTAGTDVSALSIVYSGLTKLDVKGNPVPDLASSWKWAKNDARSRSRCAPTWPSRTVRSSTRRPSRPTSCAVATTRSPLIAPQLAPIHAGAHADSTTVTLVLNQLDWDLPRVLAGKTGELVSPKAIADNPAGLATQPVGAGPFKLTKLVSGSQATLVRNPSYWDAKDVLLSELDLQFIPNPQTVVAALKTGSVNFAWITTNTTIPALTVAEQHRRQRRAEPAREQHRGQRRDAALQQPEGRAGGQLRDRPPDPAQDGLREHRQGQLPGLPRGYVGYSQAAANLYPYDPAKAKGLLASAGYANGGPAFPITYFDYGPFKALAEALQSELNAVGFQTTLTSIPLAQAGTAVYVNHKRRLQPERHLRRESPLQMLEIQYAHDGLLNPCRCAPSKLTAAFNAVAKTPTDSPKYAGLLQNASAIAAKTSANVFLTTQPWVYARSTKVQGVQPYLVAQRFEGVYVEQS